MPPQDYPHAPRHPLVRHALIALGWVAVALGVLGVVLPVMPTVPFLLVAAWAFSRSSERFHRWIYTHPHFGPPLIAWNRYRVIPVPGKIVAVVGMLGSLVLVTVFVADGWLLPTLHAAAVVAISVYVLTRPSRPPAHPPKDARASPSIGQVPVSAPRTEGD